MTNRQGIPDKTFSVLYRIQGSWSPNGNTQDINIVSIPIVYYFLLPKIKLKERNTLLETSNSQPGIQEPCL